MASPDFLQFKAFLVFSIIAFEDLNNPCCNGEYELEWNFLFRLKYPSPCSARMSHNPPHSQTQLWDHGFMLRHISGFFLRAAKKSSNHIIYCSNLFRECIFFLSREPVNNELGFLALPPLNFVKNNIEFKLE